MALGRLHRAGLAGLFMLLFCSIAMKAAVSCAGIPAWSATTTYAAGAQVTYAGGLYKALVSTTNVPPNYCAACGWWQFVDTCGTATCTAAPAVPTGLASPSQTSSSINLSWTAVTAPANCTVTYTVYRGGSSVASGLAGTSTTISGLTANTSYSFTVAAMDAAGASAQSAALTVKTLSVATCTAAPAVPTGLASPSQTNSSVNLSWNAVTPPANCSVTYSVYQGGNLVLTVPTTTAVIGGLAASTTYTFTVASVDAAGISAQSTALSVTTSGGSGVDCSNANPYSPTTTYTSGVQVLYKGSLYQALSTLTNVAPDYCLACGWWKLVGVCNPILPSVPTGLAVTARTKNSISLSWNASTDKNGPGLAGYDVFRNGVQVGTSTSTSFTDSGLALGTTYTYAVRSRDTAGAVSALSGSITASTKSGDCLAAPSVPTGLAASGVTASGVTLKWNASTADVNCTIQYQVYRNGTLQATVAGTSATFSNLASGSSYSFTVASVDEAGSSAQSSAVSVNTPAGRAARVGYFIQWGVYARQFFVKNMDTSGMAAKLTHINYAFANIDPVNLTVLNGKVSPTSLDPQSPTQGDGGCDAAADYANVMSAAQSVDGVADVYGQPLAGQFNQLLKLKKKYPHLKTLISIGGWTYSKYFSDVAATDAARKKFVASAIDAYILGNLPVYNGFGGPGSAKGVFDGIDIDWEWPGAPGHAGNHYSPNDKANFVLLMKEFRTQLDALNDGQHHLLTAFGPAGPQNLDAGWDLPGLMTSFDMVNVQGYDFHGAGSDNSWEPNLTGHQSNLYTDVNDPYSFHFSCDAAIQYYLDAGVNPRQLTLGVPFYGRGWKGVTAGSVNGEWQAAAGAACGQFGCDNLESGTRETYNLKASIFGTVYHDTQAVATYLYTGNGGEWWSYDDAWSIQQKMNYVKSKNLLGAMIWELCGDDGTLMTALDSNLP